MTPPRPSRRLLRALAGRAAVRLSSVALALGRWATAPAREDLTTRDRAVRSADLPCRCGDRQDQHRPVTAGGCTRCPCHGFALAPREELDSYTQGRADLQLNWRALPPEPGAIRGGIQYPARTAWTPDGPGPVGYGCPVVPLYPDNEGA